MPSHYQKTTFLLSAAETKQLPPDVGYEVAIVGRSNAGKSSVLNIITGSKQLARVSKTPGRTQLLNTFVIDKNRRIIDLPGYGYAKVAMAVKLKWHKTIDRYIAERQSLRGLILVMDIRHPLKDLDLQLLQYCEARGLAVHVLLNKSDKLSFSAVKTTLNKVKAVLTQLDNHVSLQSFSALSGAGKQELQRVLDTWYHFKESNK